MTLTRWFLEVGPALAMLVMGGALIHTRRIVYIIIAIATPVTYGLVISTLIFVVSIPPDVDERMAWIVSAQVSWMLTAAALLSAFNFNLSVGVARANKAKKT